MKKLILAAVLCISATAQAITPEDVFGTIFDIIANEVNNNNGGNNNGGNNNNNGGNHNNNGGGNKVILKNSGDKIVLGNLVITENKGVSNLAFPPCNASNNQRVTRLRMFFNDADVYVETVKVTFQNGNSQTFNVQDSFSDGDASGWLRLKAARCVSNIRVVGEIEGGNWNPAPPKGAEFSFGFGNGPKGPNGPNGPGNHNGGWNNDRAVISFVGLKEI